jgi:hypothetical protein
LPKLLQTVRRQHEHQRSDSDFEQQKGLVVIALANVDRVQRQRNGFSRRGIGPCRGLSAPCLAALVEKHADEIFHVLGPQAEINWALLAALDLQADGFAVWRNIADDVHDKWRGSAASLFFMGCQSCLPGELFLSKPRIGTLCANRSR